jgi:hypothetical protein
MIKIFGLLFFVILICLIYLYYQGKISRNIPIIFMFFIILIIPFTYLENNNNVESFSSYDQIMNSSLDIFYTNQNRKNKETNWLKKYPILHNPLQATLVRRKLKPVEVYLYAQSIAYNGIYVVYDNVWYGIYNSYQISDNVFTYLIASDFESKNYVSNIKSRITKFNNLSELDNLIQKAPELSYIIITANNIGPIHRSTNDSKNTFKNKYKFSNWIDSNSNGCLLVVLSKKSTDLYEKMIEKTTETSNFLNMLQTVRFDDVSVETGGVLFNNVPTNDKIVSIENDPLIKSKINIISPVNLSPDYSLSITVENNESFVYLSSRKLADEVVLYAKSPKNDIGPTSTTYLDTQKPQFWSFEPVTQIVTEPLIVFIRTYSKPYFYLDAEMENGVMILKAKRFKAGLRQYWELIKDPANLTQYRLRHLKSKMYLAYSDYDGYLYNNDGSVFLTKSEKYNWNIKKMAPGDINKNVIEGFEADRVNSYIGMEVPTDFGTVKDPSWKISKSINGKDVVIESKGRTVWEKNFGPIWSGKWIYYGTVDSYKATQNINNVKFLLIKIDQVGSGIVEDEYLGYKMDVINAGSNILTGIIPTGKYKGYRAKLELIETSLVYKDPSSPFPVKMRYIIELGSTILNLSSGNIYNMQGYSTKFVGDKLVLSNFMEASGIQTDAQLAFSAEALEKINKNIKEQISIPPAIKIAGKYITITRPKLLYKASVNGWSPSTFHQLCDNKGPTITVATLLDDRFIGAYSPISWQNSNTGYTNNMEAFLFDSDKKYTTIQSAWGPGNYAIYQLSSYGPTFGGGHDFITLSNWNPKSLSNNAWTFINNGKGPLGVPKNNYNSYQLKDLEVYSVTLDNSNNTMPFEKVDNLNCVYSRLYNGYRRDGSRNDYKWLGDFNSYEDCLKYGNIPSNTKAITYHNNNISGWARQCFSINDNNTYVANQNYAVCGIRTSGNITPKIMYGPWISKEQTTQTVNINGKIVHIIFDDNYTKMISSDGEEKYYKGTIQQFNPKNWNSYSNTGGGKYLLK